MKKFLAISFILASSLALGQTVGPGGGGSGGGGGAVSSVANSDGTLTISPTTGAVVGSLALGHPNIWSAAQTFGAGDLIITNVGPPSDSTTALQITKADLATRIIDIDTTNARIGINKTPGAFDLDVNGSANFGGAVTVGFANTISFNSRGIISSPTSGTIQIGNADNGVPTAQILQAQSVAAGNANTAAPNFTIGGGKSNGTGGGNLIFSTTNSNAPSGVQNTLSAALTLTAGTNKAARSSGVVGTLGYTVATLPTGMSAGDRAYVTDQLTTCVAAGAALTGGGAVTCPVFYNGSGWVGD